MDVGGVVAGDGVGVCEGEGEDGVEDWVGDYGLGLGDCLGGVVVVFGEDGGGEGAGCGEGGWAEC